MPKVLRHRLSADLPMLKVVELRVLVLMRMLKGWRLLQVEIIHILRGIRLLPHLNLHIPRVPVLEQADQHLMLKVNSHRLPASPRTLRVLGL
jgi:hypothetical protein